ncbi:hypothetical protein TZ02_06705 [Clostridium aceticum]|nr:hypothetical protein TZ02_06705 [Clostridium aceticum]
MLELNIVIAYKLYPKACYQNNLQEKNRFLCYTKNIENLLIYMGIMVARSKRLNIYNGEKNIPISL